MNTVFGNLGMATAVNSGAIRNTALNAASASASGTTGECVDAWNADGNPVNTQAAAINVCDGGPDQYWTEWSNGMLSNDGLCLDITGGSWKKKTPLELWQCTARITRNGARCGASGAP